MSEVIYEYYRKELEGFKILVRLDPKSFAGLELIITKEGEVQKTKRSFDGEIYEDLAADEFEKASPLEFNLYLKGVK